MPKYPENLIHFCRPVLEHYELEDEMGRMFVRSMALMGGHFPTILGSFWGHWDLAVKWVLSDRSIDLRL